MFKISGMSFGGEARDIDPSEIFLRRFYYNRYEKFKKSIISSPGNIFESFKNHLALLFPIRKPRLKESVIKIESFRCT